MGSNVEERIYAVAILDFIGGLMGVFVFCVLLDWFWFTPSGVTNVTNPTVVHAAERVLYEIANFYVEDKDPDAPHVFSSESFDTFAFAYIVLLYILAVLSVMHIIFAPLLVIGVRKNYVYCMKFWLVFKVTAIFVTTMVFIGFCFRFTFIMAVTFMVFFAINVVFLCITTAAVVAVPKGPIGSTAESFQLEYATAPDGILERMVKFVEETSINTKGLYRNPGNEAGVKMLFTILIKNPYTNIGSLKLQVTTIASALKELVSHRITPSIIPVDQLNEIEQIAQISDRSNRLQKLKEVISQMPTPNFTALRILFTHLAKVASQSHFNSMDSKNLAMAWWPTIFMVDIADTTRFQQVEPFFKDLAQTMIDNSQLLFTVVRQSIVPSNAESAPVVVSHKA